jgi:predicted permease
MLRQELRYGLRMLAKHPAFIAIAVLTLALGIGANSAVFSVVNAVMLRPLPFRSPDELVSFHLYDVHEGAASPTADSNALSYPDFADLRGQNRVFENMAVYVNAGLTLTDGANATHLQGERISAALFNLLGVQPIIGRTFRPDEDEPGHRMAILSYALWQRQFGGDSGIVGKSITLDGEKFQVVGIMPARFTFPIGDFPPEIWTTVSILRESRDGSRPMTEQRGNDFLKCIGRLKPNVSIEQAQANIDTIAAALRQQYPDSNMNVGVKLWPLSHAMVADARSALLMLCAMAGCVLLVACVNFANLLLARALSRQREVSIRAALGASRWYIVRQLLVESALLGICGGIAGLLLATWGLDALKAFLPKTIPRIDEASTDYRVLAFTTLISLFVGMGVGLLPAWRASHPNLIGALNESTRGSSESGHGRRLRAALVVVEMVLALVLLASAGLLVESFVRLQHVRPGFDPQHVTTARVVVPDAGYGKPQQAATFYRNLLAQISALPGVESAAAAWWIPLSGSEVAFSFDIQERPLPKSQQPTAQANVVTNDYFKTLRTSMVSGRDFTARDNRDAPKVVIVSESFAKEFFAGENPVGKRIQPNGSTEPGDPPMREIVGVVQDIHLISLRDAPKPQIYIPHEQFPIQSVTLFIRSRQDPKHVGTMLRDVVGKIDKDVPAYRVRALTDYVSQSVAQPRLNAMLVGFFALIALLLAAAGIFGVMSYAVTQRTQEIGIRFALGAQRPQVLRLILSDGMKLVAIGVALGLLGVFGVGRILRTLLYGIAATDLATLAAVSAMLAFVAFLACWWPAQRASNVDPIVALREQ